MRGYVVGAVLCVVVCVGIGTALDAVEPARSAVPYDAAAVTPGLGERAAVRLLETRGYRVTSPAYGR